MLKLNTIFCGECSDLMKEIDSGSVNLTVTSPPYDDLRDYEGYDFDFPSIAKQLYRVTQDGGVVVWVVGDQTKNFCETLSSFKQAIFFVEECGFNLLDTMIYQKKGGPSPYPTMMRYAPWFEYMFVFSKGKPRIFNAIRDRENRSWGKANRGNTARQKDGSTKRTPDYVPEKFSIRNNIWLYDVGRNKDTKDKVAFEHPARFPEALARDHIITWSNEGDLVLDPMCGSGTTCKQAQKNGRNFIGIDISEKYCEIARARLKKKYKKSAS
jgi:site-specific DNA-methyltransferase (adenine-specific)